MKSGLKDETSLFAKLRKRKINNKSGVKNNENINNSNNNYYTSNYLGSRGSNLRGNRIVDDDDDDTGAQSSLHSKSGLTAKECVELVDLLDRLFIDPFANPKYDIKGKLGFQTFDEAIRLEPKDVRHDPHVVAFEAIKALPQGNAFVNYLNVKQWPMPKGMDVFRTTKAKSSDKVVAPFCLFIIIFISNIFNMKSKCTIH